MIKTKKIQYEIYSNNLRQEFCSYKECMLKPTRSKVLKSGNYGKLLCTKHFNKLKVKGNIELI